MFTIIQNSFTGGELSPSIFGRTDLQKYHSGTSTMRNLFVDYRGAAASRAGTAYVGMCKQGAPNAGGTPTNNPPRDINFQYNLLQGFCLEFGDYYMRVKSNGAYVTEAPINITGITQANPGVVTVPAHGYSNGDWVFASNIDGMTELNGLTFIVQNETTDTFTLTDLFGNPIITTTYNAYTDGGTFARIYTLVTPYAALNLQFLKYTQSANTMSLTLRDQTYGTEYPPYDLVRVSAADWTLTEVDFASSIVAPTGTAATAQSSTTPTTYYSYVVTAVAADGEESVASNAASIQNNDISIFAGSNLITWNPVPGAVSYNVYGATPCYGAPVPPGVLYGFIGESLATNFVDTNIVADFTTVPPTHQDPFARGAIAGANPTDGGSGYTQAGVAYDINTTTGTDAIILPIVNGGEVVSYVVVNGGKNYAPTDTISVTADGAGATANLIVGPETGTYPGTVAYYQQRRAYANTINDPDTYFMSQPGAFLNMDSSIPASDTDAIIGAPWAQQINGIQFMVPMPGGLVILSGMGAWQLNGGNSAALTPADQDANPQAYNGCNSHIQPIVVNYDILYVQSKGSVVRDLSYNFFVNIYTGTDTTVLSNHLFNNFQLIQWAYAEEPYKIIWAVRSDGALLSLTYLKEQEIASWARHDTNGLFQDVCVVTESSPIATQPLVDAVYVIVKRYVNGQWVYYSERMDNRNWTNVEECWCVDSGLSYPMTSPNATLTPSAANGTSNISGINLIDGGELYTAPVITAIDSTGAGKGATFGYTLGVNGKLSSIIPINQGQFYTPGATKIIIQDANGSGAIAAPIITNNVDFTTSSDVFSPNMVGDVIRVGGGKATINSYVSSQEVVANITQPITSTIPNDPNNLPVPAIPNSWTISTPTSVVTGLNHLNGLQVAILADGSVINNQTVKNGEIDLPVPYSQITIGLPFTVQLQTMYLDPPSHGDTSQGKRKDLFAVTVRMENSRGISIGSNQVDSSTQPNNANVPWTGLYSAKERNAQINAGSAIPLFTGDEYVPIGSDWDEKGQVSIQSSYPLPLNILSVISWYVEGDTSG